MLIGMTYEIDGEALSAEGKIMRMAGVLFFSFTVLERPWINTSGQCFYQDLPKAVDDLMATMERKILYHLSPLPAYEHGEIEAFITAHSVSAPVRA